MAQNQAETTHLVHSPQTLERMEDVSVNSRLTEPQQTNVFQCRYRRAGHYNLNRDESRERERERSREIKRESKREIKREIKRDQERERERDQEIKRERSRDQERERVCVYVCVCQFITPQTER